MCQALLLTVTFFLLPQKLWKRNKSLKHSIWAWTKTSLLLRQSRKTLAQKLSKTKSKWFKKENQSHHKQLLSTKRKEKNLQIWSPSKQKFLFQKKNTFRLTFERRKQNFCLIKKFLFINIICFTSFLIFWNRNFQMKKTKINQAILDSIKSKIRILRSWQSYRGSQLPILSFANFFPKR